MPDFGKMVALLYAHRGTILHRFLIMDSKFAHLSYPNSLWICLADQNSISRPARLVVRRREDILAEKSIAAANAYIQALTDALKKLPKDDPNAVSVRKGSDVEKIRDLLITEGRPLHLNDIIEKLGREVDADSKAKVAGLLGWYTSKNKIFSKVAPNTYGILEAAPSVEIPSDFGVEAEEQQ